MSIDNSMVYKQYIEQIKNEENQAILDKNWTKVAKLSVKKAELEAKIDKIEQTN